MIRLLIVSVLVILSESAFYLPLEPNADGISGTWKRTKMTLVDASGKTTDMMQMLSNSIPCTKDITYTFTSNGQMTTNIPDACVSMKKTVEAMNATGKWTSTGKTVTITTTMKGIPPATYNLELQGNTMTWTFNYADNPQTPNPTKAQQTTIVYQRI